MKEIDTYLFHYAEKQYDTQTALLRDINTKIANVLVAIGFLLTLTAYLANAIFKLQLEPWLLLPLLTPSILGAYSFLRALGRVIHFLRLQEYKLPSMEADIQKAIIDLQKKNKDETNESDILQDLTQNYITAFNDNMTSGSERHKLFKILVNYIRNGIISIIISFVVLFFIKTPTCLLTGKEKREEVKMIRNMDQEKEEEQKQDNEPNNEKNNSAQPQEPSQEPEKTQQPSVLGNPTLVTASDHSTDSETVSSDDNKSESKPENESEKQE
ncbi:MAG: hypothetical protein GY858_09535 [Candidatus Omnitrophica bacterium]|nr:hypothetical protein [Candidatus Omnitrophota bacterium]